MLSGQDMKVPRLDLSKVQRDSEDDEDSAAVSQKDSKDKKDVTY